MTAGESQGGVGDALRVAVERTLNATLGSAAAARERATGLADEIAKRGTEARERLARRGGEARDELSRQVQSLERRLAAIEETLRGSSKDKPEG